MASGIIERWKASA